LASIRANRVAIKGPVATPLSAKHPSTNVRMRKELDLYACVRPCRWMPGVRSRYRDVDIVVVRENTEDLYTGIEFEQGEVATKEPPGIDFEDRIIDALSMQLVQRPGDFDVLVLPNLYGDVVSDLCAGLVGGLGVAPGGHLGDDIAVFEPTHGTGPRIKGPD